MAVWLENFHRDGKVHAASGVSHTNRAVMFLSLDNYTICMR